MKNLKKIKFILPALTFVPLIGGSVVLTSCGSSSKPTDPDIKKITIMLDDQELKDKTEFDIQKVSKLQLKAKVEPEEYTNDVSFEIMDQEGAGNIACSSTGIIYTNDCVGTITVRATSPNKTVCSDAIELVFWDSASVNFYTVSDEASITGHRYSLAFINEDYISSIENVVVPTTYNNGTLDYPVYGVGYGAFNGCTKLDYLRLPLNSTDFTFVGSYAFYQCNSLKKVVLPEHVIQINDSAFCNCTSLESVSMGNEVFRIGAGAFDNCVALTEINLSNTLAAIGPSAFNQCILLPSINIPASVQIIGSEAFANCWNLEITVDPNSQYFVIDHRCLYSHDKTRLLCHLYPLEEGTTSLDFVIPKCVKQIDAKAFEYCDRIKNITFEEGSQCTYIGESCFELCSSLEKINIPSSLTELQAKTFAHCWNLTNITVPNNIEVIRKNVFYGCDKLTSVNFENPYGDKECSWTVTNTAVNPTYMNQDINVNWYKGVKIKGVEVEDETSWRFVTANRLKEEGYYSTDPTTGITEWAGGFCNCVWTKNSIPIGYKNDGGSPPYVIPVEGSNRQYINTSTDKLTVKIFFNKDVTADMNYKMYLRVFNEYGNPIICSDEIALTGAANETKDITLTLTKKLIDYSEVQCYMAPPASE